MVSIVVDPAVVMIPPSNTNRAEIEAWFKCLESWLNEALTAPFTWLHYLQATYLLEANGQFPSFEQIRRLQKIYNLDINLRQLSSHINEFFRDETLDLHEHLEQLNFIVEAKDASIIIRPEQFMVRLPAYIHNDFRGLLADCCVCKHIGYPFSQELHIATLALDDVSKKEIAVSVVVLDAFPDFVRPPDNKIEQTFPLLITPNDLQPLINVTKMWMMGEHGIVYAINEQYKKEWSSTVAMPLTFHLGRRFVESVNNRGLDSNEIVLRSIIRAAVDIIADNAKSRSGYKLHHLRWDDAADSPQRTRDSDNAKAWRLMLQKQGAGWRLHYWQIPTTTGSIIEFANVCKESEREIF